MPSADPSPTSAAASAAIATPGATAPPSVRTVSLGAPLQWLDRGARDLWRCPVPGLLHGLAATLFGVLLLGLARDRFWLLAGAFSGFLLVAPLLATALYLVSRELEGGRCIGVAAALAIYRRRDARLIGFGLLLALAGTGWVLTSAAFVTTFAGAPVRAPIDFVRHVVLASNGWLFEGWLLLGGVLAAPIFASTVVALPLLVDRQISLHDAVLCSWRAVLTNPVALALWALCLAALVLFGMGLGLIGLVLMVPWLGHASWHAYRDLVVTDPAGRADSALDRR